MSEHTSDAEDEFLSHLPPDTPVFHYHPQCSLESLLPPPAPHDTFVVIKGFPQEAFDEIDESLPGRLDYSFSLKILILKMPSRPHEAAADKFGVQLGILASQMRVNRRVENIGATDIHGKDRAKQADRSWMPVRTQGQFPTVVLEVGYSETAAKLEKDIAWWVKESRGRMNMGITIDIKRGSSNIEIKTWVPTTPIPNHVYITASGREVVNREINPRLPLRVSQRMFIKKGKNGMEPTIEGGDLTIPFKALLLDEPGEGEGDFIFTKDILLHDLADFIWLAIEKYEA